MAFTAVPGPNRPVVSFSKIADIVPVPSLTDLQASSYDRFLDLDGTTDQRNATQGIPFIPMLKRLALAIGAAVEMVGYAQLYLV